MVLTEEQIASFKQNGHLRINGFIDEGARADWLSQVWKALGTTRETMHVNPPIPKALNGFQFDAVTEPARYPALLEIVDQLGGGGRKGS